MRCSLRWGVENEVHTTATATTTTSIIITINIITISIITVTIATITTNSTTITNNGTQKWARVEKNLWGEKEKMAGGGVVQRGFWYKADINSSCTQKNERKSFEENCGSYLARQALRVEITASAFGWKLPLDEHPLLFLLGNIGEVENIVSLSVHNTEIISFCTNMTSFKRVHIAGLPSSAWLKEVTPSPWL